TWTLDFPPFPLIFLQTVHYHLSFPCYFARESERERAGGDSQDKVVALALPANKNQT
ncbi:uncharacterized, partial [Tachysurus ichikawai]